MEIQHSKTQATGTLVRAPMRALMMEEAEAARRKEADRVRAELGALQGRAAWLAALVYGYLPLLKQELVALGAKEEPVCFEGPGASTIALAFVLEGRAWLVFRGTNDGNDWARNFMCRPGNHFGFNRCYADIDIRVQQWIDTVAKQDVRFCITGHSLGGALATLAAYRIGRQGHPVEILCTFGGPRALSTRQADEYSKASANLGGEVFKSLDDVTYRFVDRLELVSKVPFAILGFRHVGKEIVCKRLPPAAAQTAFGVARPPIASDEWWEGLSYAIDDARDGMGGLPAFAFFVWPLQKFAIALYRILNAMRAHDKLLYARKVDPEGLFRIGDSANEAGDPRKVSVRLSSWIVLGIVAVSVLALGLAFAWLVARYLGIAPWATILGTLPLVLLGIFSAFTQK